MSLTCGGNHDDSLICCGSIDRPVSGLLRKYDFVSQHNLMFSEHAWINILGRLDSYV